MKIIIYNAYWGHDNLKAVSKALKYKLLKLGCHEVMLYNEDFHPQEAFRAKEKNYQMYEGFFDYCVKEKADVMYIYWMINPHYFLAELEVRKNFKPKVVYIFSVRDAHRSLSKGLMFKKLIDHPNTRPILCCMLNKDNEVMPKKWLSLNPDMDKVKLMVEPFVGDPQLLLKDARKSKKIYKVLNKKFVILFFGYNRYVKGLDILAEAANDLHNDINILIQAAITDDNFEIDLQKFIKRKNITHFPDSIDYNQMVYIYNACEVVVLPYRRYYEFALSSLPPEAAMARKLVIFPDLHPFNKLAKQFKTGVVFEPENAKSLAKAINYCYNNYSILKKEAQFDEYLKTITTLNEIAEFIKKA